MLSIFKARMWQQTGTLITALAFILCIGAGSMMPSPLSADENPATEKTLETLFRALSETDNFQASEVLTLQIWETWINNNDDKVNIQMMYRGINFMDTGNLAIAEEVFSRIISRDADYTEAWNKRATVRYLLNNIQGSEQDIIEVLTREPRHFGAMSGLGLIKIQQGKLQDALVIYKDILKIHPTSPDAVRMVPQLEGVLKGDPV